MADHPADLTALEARDRIAAGSLSSADLVAACLARIDEREGAVGAWVHVDRAGALAAAAAADRKRAAGAPLPPLHGVPAGIKDIIDTAGLPTENGTVLDAGRVPARDATVVARLRAAGAIVLGKTVTTECAYFSVSKTRNPHDRERTPGGSSSGSAAAVAAGMVPLAIGTQTGGSTIRPASFCGVVGLKPTHGLIPRAGILRHSAWLDTVGIFARSVEDAALAADTMAGHDPADADTRPAAAPDCLALASARPAAAPRFGFLRPAAWDKVEAGSAAALSALAEDLGARAIAFPDDTDRALAAQRTVAFVGMARSLGPYVDRGRDRLGPGVRDAVDSGRAMTGVDYLAAVEHREELIAALDRAFAGIDAILTPAAVGEAPPRIGAPPAPDFCGLWTLVGAPALSLPLLAGPSGLPVGVQLIGRRGEDGALLRTARWLAAREAASGALAK